MATPKPAVAEKKSGTEWFFACQNKSAMNGRKAIFPHVSAACRWSRVSSRSVSMAFASANSAANSFERACSFLWW